MESENHTAPILMKSRPHIPFLAFFLLSACSVVAQEKTFPEYNCAITPPAGWHQMTNLPPQKVFCAGFRNSSETLLLMLIIADVHKLSGPLDDQTVDGIEKGLESSGMGKRDSGKFIEIAGIKSYERTGHVLAQGKNSSTITQMVLADGKLYSINAMRTDGSASDDPTIRAALGSFRFITPPSPSPSATDRTAYTIGKYVGIVLVGLIGVVLRQRREKRQEPPPPLPPNTQQ